MGAIAGPGDERRPLLLRDVFWARLEDALLVHNSETGFEVRSPGAFALAEQVLPRLDGHTSVGEIAADLDPAARGRLAQLVAALLQRGFARETDPSLDAGVDLPAAVARRYAAEIEYIRHFRDGARAAFARFRNTRFLVVGRDDTARWTATALLRCGAAHILLDPQLLTPPSAGVPDLHVEAAEAAADGAPARLDPHDPIGVDPAREDNLADVVLVSPDPAATGLLFRLCALPVPAGRSLLGAFCLGEDVVLGPLVDAAGGACPVCAALRLGANVAPGASAQLWSAIATPGSAAMQTPLAGPAAAMVGNLLGFEAMRAVTGIGPVETRGRVVVHDVVTGDARARSVVAHPYCSACYPGKAVDVTVPDGLLARCVAHLIAAAQDTGIDLDVVNRERLERREPAVDDRVGIATRFDDDTLIQSPIKVSRLHLGLGPTQRRVVTTSDIYTVLRCRNTAFDAAARLYLDHVVGRPAASGAVSERAFPGERYVLSTSPEPGTFDPGYTVPGPADADTVRGWSLLDGRTVAVPAAVMSPFGPANARSQVQRSGAGTGVGDDLIAAAADALTSALAHAALTAVLAGTDALAVLAFTDPDAELAFVLDAGVAIDQPIELAEIGERPDLPVRTVLARSGELWSVRAAATLGAAARRAACDVLAAAQLSSDGDVEPCTAGDPLLPAWDGRLTATAPTREVSAAAALATPDPAALNWSGHGLSDAVVVPWPAADLLRYGVMGARVALIRSG